MFWLFGVFIFTVIFGWPKFYRWAYFPKRPPDFSHNARDYWFDEGVRYFGLGSPKRLHFSVTEDKQLYYPEWGMTEMSHNFLKAHAASLGKKYVGGKLLSPEVQLAYKQHIDRKFEEEVLGLERFDIDAAFAKILEDD